MSPRRSAIPRIDIVGLGPAGPELITQETHALMTGGGTVFLRTARHPASGRYPDVPTFDHYYEGADDFAQVYESIVADLVTAARREPWSTPSPVHPPSPNGRSHCCERTRPWLAARSTWWCTRRCRSSTSPWCASEWTR